MADFLKIFGTNKRLAGRYNSICLEWCKASEGGKIHGKVVRVPNEDKTQVPFTMKSYMLTGTFILVCIQTYGMQYKRKEIKEETFGWLTVACLMTINFCFHMMWRKAPDIATLINALLQFDRMHGKKAKDFREQPFTEMISICLTYVGEFSVLTVPISFVFGIHWQQPCKSSLAGYWLIPSCMNMESDSMTTYIGVTVTKALVCSINCWIWGLGVETAFFATGVIQNLLVGIIRDNLNTLFNKYCEDFKQSSRAKRALVFRHIQLLVFLLNDIQRGPLILVLIVGTISISAFSVATLVKKKNADMVCIATLFYLLTSCAKVIILIIGGMAKIYVKSEMLLDRMKLKWITGISKHELKLEEKFYQSCGPLEITITSSNFVDQLTPLNLLHFSMSLSANIILLE